IESQNGFPRTEVERTLINKLRHLRSGRHNKAALSAGGAVCGSEGERDYRVVRTGIGNGEGSSNPACGIHINGAMLNRGTRTRSGFTDEDAILPVGKHRHTVRCRTADIAINQCIARREPGGHWSVTLLRALNVYICSAESAVI